MKTLLILFLSFALLAAAFFTRPGRREFMLYVMDRELAGRSDWSPSAIDRADDTARGVEFKNRWLWTDAEKDGKVVYTGAFAHWFARGQKTEMNLPSAKELAKLIKR